MNNPVHLVAIGARTPLGTRAESSAAAVRARISRLREHPVLVDPKGEPIVGAMDGLLDPLLLDRTRVSVLALSALTEVIEQLDLTVPSSCSIRVLMGLPESRPGFTDMDQDHVLTDVLSSLSAEHPERRVELRCIGRGNAAGLHAFTLASDQLRRGEVDLCVVGGAESYFHPETLGWLMSHNLLARKGVRGGFFPGEGAGFVAMASETAQRRWRLKTLCTLNGAASCQEKYDPSSSETGLGEALTAAVRGATQGLKPPHEVVSGIFCDINGERARTEEWGFSVLRTARMLADGSSYHAPSSYWGDQGASSGPLFAVLAVQSWRRGYARGPYSLLWAASRQGLRSAIVLKRPER